MKEIKDLKELIYKLYITENLSRDEVADKLNLTKNKIKWYLRKYKIYKSKDSRALCQKGLTLIKYNVPCTLMVPDVKEKAMTTNLKKYGKKEVLSSNFIRNKIKSTNIQKYGFEYSQLNPEIRKKIKETCVKKSKDTINKTRKTTKLKYGNESIFKTKFFSELMQTKFGTSNVLSNSSVLNKKRKTCIERYGTDIPSKSKVIIDLMKKTCLERYGFEWAMQNEDVQKKAMGTKKENLKKFLIDLKNNTLDAKSLKKIINTSKEEIKIYKNLCFIFGCDDVDWQYKSELYPFNCDFYIPSLDLYIEYQGFWTHGGHPFDPNSEEDAYKLNLWKEREYRSAIDVWTMRDPLKREIANKNNLNWLEFFDIKEFKNWADTIKGL